MNYTITGATGNLGSRIVNQMIHLAAPEDIVALVHTPSKAKALSAQDITVKQGDYLDIDSMVQALSGTDLLIYVPSKTYDVLQRVTELENTIEAMKKANVKKIIFISFFADQEKNPFIMSAYYGYAPRRLAGSGLEYTVIKNSLYADPLVPYLPELIERKNIIYPVGNEALSFITLDDSAEAISKLAVQPGLRDNGQTYLLSQEKNHTMKELSEMMNDITDEEIGYSPVSLEEFSSIYEADGNELSSMYHGGALGMLADVTNDFQTITGHSPKGMKEFLQENYH